MADAWQSLRWKLMPSDRATILDMPLTKGALWGLADDRLFWKAIRVGKLHDRLWSEFIQTEPIWIGLWLHSPLTTVQCSILYDLFSLFIVREKELNKRLTALLRALQEASAGRGQLNVALNPPGLAELGFVTTFAHCPRCKVLAPVPLWEGSKYHDEITCSICGTRYVPSEMIFTKEIDDEPDEEIIAQDHTPKKQIPILSKFFLSRLWFCLTLPWEIASDLFRSAIWKYHRKVRVRRRPLKPSQQR